VPFKGSIKALPGSDTIHSIACHCLRSRESDYKLAYIACSHAAFQGMQPVGLFNATISELTAFTFVAACYFSSMGSVQFVTSLYAIYDNGLVANLYPQGI